VSEIGSILSGVSAYVDRNTGLNVRKLIKRKKKARRRRGE
jgi:hypothetical protein